MILKHSAPGRPLLFCLVEAAVVLFHVHVIGRARNAETQGASRRTSRRRRAIRGGDLQRVCPGFRTSPRPFGGGRSRDLRRCLVRTSPWPEFPRDPDFSIV